MKACLLTRIRRKKTILLNTHYITVKGIPYSINAQCYTRVKDRPAHNDREIAAPKFQVYEINSVVGILNERKNNKLQPCKSKPLDGSSDCSQLTKRLYDVL